MKNQFIIVLLLFTMYSRAQGKTGIDTNTGETNSSPDVKRMNNGFTPERVALNSTVSTAPLTGKINAGMLVYNAGGTLIDGYYYWNGIQWVMLANGETNMVTKTADAKLTKAETTVLASNDITLTLPVITSSDNGFSITIKNAGTCTDLVTVKGSDGALLDDSKFVTLPRWISVTMTAHEGKWYCKDRSSLTGDILHVSTSSSWQTLQEAIEFLKKHMSVPTVIELGSGSFDITGTQVINLPYTLTIRGNSYGTTAIAAATGLRNKPMFRCVSECNFKMLKFKGTALDNYGDHPGEDAIRFIGKDTYNEIKDCSFDQFYNAIIDSTNAELWLFETDISHAKGNGLLIQGDEPRVTVKVAETDFIDCARGINLNKGSAATIQLSSGGYYNALPSDTAIVYNPANFTSFVSISITGNLWNNTGKYIEGFDFARSDARDAKVVMEGNAGTGDRNPSCQINVLRSDSTTSLNTTGAWYKANWRNTTYTSCKWTIHDNRMIYQPTNRRNAIMIVSGNLSCNNVNRTISIGIVKNGILTTRYGETRLSGSISNQPCQFSTVVYLTDVGPGDYFEIYCSSATGGDVVKFQDVLWLANAN